MKDLLYTVVYVAALLSLFTLIFGMQLHFMEAGF